MKTLKYIFNGIKGFFNVILICLTLVFASGPFMLFTYKSTLIDINNSVLNTENATLKKRLNIVIFFLAALLITVINFWFFWLVLWYFNLTPTLNHKP